VRGREEGSSHIGGRALLLASCCCKRNPTKRVDAEAVRNKTGVALKKQENDSRQLEITVEGPGGKEWGN